MECEYTKEQEALLKSGCFTIIAGKDVSATGRVLVGHNEDDGGRTVFRYTMVPQADWPQGAVIPAEIAPSEFAPARQDVPQVRHTSEYFWGEVLDITDGKCVGMSGADRLMNEHGVCVVTNNGGLTLDPPLGGGTQEVFYVLRRAMAEQAKTPRQGVLIAARLIRDYGYKACRIYSIANSEEAWVLQVANGHQFVARKIRDDEVFVVPNFFTIRQIDFSGGSEIEPGIMGNDEWLWSKNLVQAAIDGGRYQPANPQDTTYPDFDFAYCYQLHGVAPHPYTWNTPMSSYRMRHAISLVTGKEWIGDNSQVQANHPEQGFPFTIQPGDIAGDDRYTGKVTLDMIKRVLRSHFEGTPDDPPELRSAVPGGNPHDAPQMRRICTQTTGDSLIFELGTTPALTTIWVSPGRPCELPYFPIHAFGAQKLPDKLTTVADGAAAMATHFLNHPGLTAWNPADAWWQMRDLENCLDLLHCRVMAAHTQWLHEKDASLDADNAQAVAQAAALDTPQRQAFLAQWDNDCFDTVFAELQAQRAVLPVVETEAVTPVVAKGDADAAVVVRFRLEPGRVLDEGTLLMGIGGTNSQMYNRSVPIVWQQPTALTLQDGWWTASFSARLLVAEHPAALPGNLEYYISGKDTACVPFCGMVVLTITDGR